MNDVIGCNVLPLRSAGVSAFSAASRTQYTRGNKGARVGGGIGKRCCGVPDDTFQPGRERPQILWSRESHPVFFPLS